MTPEEIADIFAMATSAYQTINHKPTFVDITKFDEMVNTILVKIPRDHDGDEFGMLYIGQDPSEYNSIIGSSLSKIGKLPAYDTNIDDAATEAVRKKEKLNGMLMSMIVKWKPQPKEERRPCYLPYSMIHT